MRKTKISIVISALMLTSTLSALLITTGVPAVTSQTLEPVDYVDPFIGTGEHGHTTPAASLPFGMVKLGPDTGTTGWDRCSGYLYSDTTIQGFSHTHLSGTGCASYGEVLFLPTTGGATKGATSKFSHDEENASPGYYSVVLKDYNIKAELTVTKRVGFHTYIFPSAADARIIVDVSHEIGGSGSGTITKVSDNEIEGNESSSAWAQHKVYFVAQFSKPFSSFQSVTNGAYLNYSTSADEVIKVKVGLSYVSTAQARLNLETEIPGWDFDAVKSQARNIWNEALSRIEVHGGTENQKVTFYTALYHSLYLPQLFSDVNGKYPGFGDDTGIYTAENYNHYTVLSIWDTFRAEHPLLALIDPNVQVDVVKSCLSDYDQGGWMPKWALADSYTNCMIGTHADSVIADSYVKGITYFDVGMAYAAMMHNAMDQGSRGFEGRVGISYYKDIGYVPCDKESQATSRTLEFTHDDFCIAQMANVLGKENDYNLFKERACYYKNVFDNDTKFMRGRNYNGSWADSGYNPKNCTNYYTEGNGWQYTWHVLQDVQGLIDLMGGRAAFDSKLDELFTTEGLGSGCSADVSGLIGNYAHGNEPCHHITYLYDYCGKPWKTQEKVRQVMDTLYGTETGSLCGNEDCGQMSAWYVFSAIGFYPVCPGFPSYEIGSPIFDKVTIHLPTYHYGGENFVIEAHNVSKENKYIQSATLNGQPLNKPWFGHSALANGGSLVFEMGPTPNENWGSAPECAPPSLSKDTTPPVISNVVSTDITAASAKITWDTDELSDSVVNYGTTTALGSTESDTAMVTSHSVTLTGLSASTTYYYEVKSTDPYGNTAVDDNNGSYYTFTTMEPDTTPPVIGNVTASSITNNSATITWDTDEISDSLVKYGTVSGSYTDNKYDSALVKSHSIELTGLTKTTTYYYIVSSTDPSGNTAESSEHSFTTEAMPEMHVASIDMAVVDEGGWDSKTHATAAVTVVDANNNLVEGATVSGHWSGLTTDTDSGVTDANGKVTLESDSTSGTGTFTFTVDDVTKEGWMYDPDANVETSDSTSN